jgi:N-acetylglucosamine kinase-like BadF-type ATPase
MDFLVGLDGGGTKTECLVTDPAGARLGGAIAAGSSLTHRPELEVRSAIADALNAARREAHLGEQGRCLAACGGFAGAGRPTVDRALRAILAELLPGAAISVLPDFRVAFEGATLGRAGVIVIAGTGSIAYGRNALGYDWRAGGWGPDVGDEGSGFRIGRDAVAAVLEARDGRRPPTALLRERVLQGWSAADEDELVDRMRVDVTGGGRPPFPALLSAVVSAAGEGDGAAREILDNAALALADLAIHVAGELDMRDPLITYAGGVFQNAPRVRDHFVTAVQLQLPAATVEAARQPPVAGAVHLAQQLASSAGRRGARV